jgi:hypothetical protein
MAESEIHAITETSTAPLDQTSFCLNGDPLERTIFNDGTVASGNTGINGVYMPLHTNPGENGYQGKGDSPEQEYYCTENNLYITRSRATKNRWDIQTGPDDTGSLIHGITLKDFPWSAAGNHPELGWSWPHLSDLSQVTLTPGTTCEPAAIVTTQFLSDANICLTGATAMTTISGSTVIKQAADINGMYLPVFMDLDGKNEGVNTVQQWKRELDGDLYITYVYHLGTNQNGRWELRVGDGVDASVGVLAVSDGVSHTQNMVPDTLAFHGVVAKDGDGVNISASIELDVDPEGGCTGVPVVSQSATSGGVGPVDPVVSQSATSGGVGPVDPVDPVVSQTATSGGVGPVDPVVSQTATSGTPDGSFLNDGCNDGGGPNCCISPTQTNNVVILEKGNGWNTGKRYVAQAEGDAITSCQMRTPLEGGVANDDSECNNHGLLELFSIWSPDHIADWFKPTDYSFGRDWLGINTKLFDCGWKSNLGVPQFYGCDEHQYDPVPAGPLTDTSKWPNGFVAHKVLYKEVITMTCEAGGDQTKYPPGLSGFHKRDFTDGLTAESTLGNPQGVAKKTELFDGGDELSSDFNANFFAPKLNDEVDDYSDNIDRSEFKGIRVIEGNWDKSTEYYTLDTSGTYLAPLTYKPLFQRQYFNHTANIVSNWETPSAAWNIANLESFGFEYMVSAENGQVGNKTGLVPDFLNHDNLNQSGSRDMYVSSDKLYALMYSIKYGWQFVDTLGGYPITVFVPGDDAGVPEAATQMRGPRWGEHEQGRLNLTYHTGVKSTFSADGEVNLVDQTGDTQYFSTDLKIGYTDLADGDQTIVGTLNHNSISISIPENRMLFTIINMDTGEEAEWQAGLEEDRMKQIAFNKPGTQQRYMISLTWMGYPAPAAQSIQSGETSTETNVGGTTQNTGGQSDPHVNTFFGEKYDM